MAAPRQVKTVPAKPYRKPLDPVRYAWEALNPRKPFPWQLDGTYWSPRAV